MGLFDNIKKKQIMKNTGCSPEGNTDPSSVEFVLDGNVIGAFEYRSDWIDRIPEIVPIPGYRFRWDKTSPKLEFEEKTVWESNQDTTNESERTGHVLSEIYGVGNVSVSYTSFETKSCSPLVKPSKSGSNNDTVVVRFKVDGRIVSSGCCPRFGKITPDCVRLEKGWKIIWGPEPDTSTDSVWNGHLVPIRMHLMHDGAEVEVRDYCASDVEKMSGKYWNSKKTLCWDIPKLSDVKSEDMYLNSREPDNLVTVIFYVNNKYISKVKCKKNEKIDWINVDVGKKHEVCWASEPDTSQDSVCLGKTKLISKYVKDKSLSDKQVPFT